MLYTATVAGYVFRFHFFILMKCRFTWELSIVNSLQNYLLEVLTWKSWSKQLLILLAHQDVRNN